MAKDVLSILTFGLAGKEQIMKATILACSCGAALIAAVATAAFGQASVPAEPYKGIVNGTDVHVRCRPGLTAYPCTKVSLPTRVTVVGSQAGWLKILPPADTFSVIEKQPVRLDAAGKVGTVTEDNVWIRAGGKLRSQDFWAIQRRAKKGSKLDIIGQTGDFYKITPPSGVHFWISGRYVTPVGVSRARAEGETTEAGRVVGAGAPEISPVITAKAAGGVVDPGATERVVEPVKTVKTPHSRAEIKAATANFLAVDRLLAAESRKPAKQRNLEAVIGKYEALRLIGGGYLQPYIDGRVRYIRAAIQREKDMGAVDNLIEETLASQREYEQRLAEMGKPAPIVAKSPARYAACGVLAQSALFSGNRAVPKRYAIRGKHTRRIIAYVQCTTGDLDFSRYVGKEVGVTGTARFESDIGLIIEARELTVLGEAGGLPLPAAPTVIEQGPRLAPASVGPAPAPAAVPKPPAVKLVPRPLPVIEPLPMPTPAPKPAIKLKPEAEPKPKPKLAPAVGARWKPKPRPKPAPPVKRLPKLAPAPNVDGVPLIIPRSKPKAATPLPRPTTRPASKLPRKPATRPAAKAALSEPLPPTGLPMIESEPAGDSSPINEEEYE